jgi:hypothetical protein
MSYKNKSSYNQNAMQLDNMVLNNQKTLDPKKAVDIFLSDYYNTITNIGWNNLFGLYYPNTFIIIKNNLVGNHHDFVSILSQNYIKRANYNGLSSKWVVNGPRSILLNIFGTMQFINFIGSVSSTFKFTETFLLTIDDNDKLKINTQMFDF